MIIKTGERLFFNGRDMIFHMMYIKTTSFNLVIGHQALRVGVGIRFSKLHQLTSGFMNPLTDMRKK